MAAKNKGTKGTLSSRLLILIFVVLAAGILVTGYLFYSNYTTSFRTQAEHQLSAIADLKAEELVQWRKERIWDANQLYGNPAFSSLVQRYFEHPDDVDAQEQLRSWLAAFQANYQYARVFLLDTQGVERIFTPAIAAPVPHHIPQDAHQALQSGKVTILDLERDEVTPQPHMVILVPIFREKDGNVPLGTVVMRIDPSQYLYPLIQSWPTPSVTAETLLIRRDGNDALFINELKFQKDTALKLRTSLENIKMPAVQAALGHEGIVEGVDYRGMLVLADVRAVPDSPWFMVARMDTSEVYSPLTQMLWVVIALIGALLIAAGAGTGMVWRQQNIRVYKERVEIADALRESEEKYRGLVETTGAGVATIDLEGNITYVNQSMLKQLGYTGDEVIGKSFAGFLYPEDMQRTLDIFMEGVTNLDYRPTLEFRLMNKAGNPVWSYSAPTPILVSGVLTGFNALVIGISERKQAEEALQVSEVKYRTLFESSPLGITISDSAGNILESNKEAERLLGLPIEEHTKRQIDGVEWIVIQPDGSPMRADDYASVRALKEKRLIENVEMGIVKDDGDVSWINVTAAPIPLESHGVVITYGDITRRKLTAEKLLRSEALLKEAQEVAHIGHWELDLATMAPVWSEEIFHIFGIDPATGEPSFAAHRDLLHPDDWDILNNAVSATSTTGAPFDIEFRLLHPVKGVRWLLAIGRAIRNDKGNISRLFGTAQDITNSKNTEENLDKSRQELRSLSLHLISLREEERTLLAREIHDELGQALTALKMDLSWLSKKLPEGKGPLAEKTASMLKLIDITVKTVKRLATELRPGLLDDLGLVAAMEWQAGEFQERTGINTELSFEPYDIMVDNEQATALFRIFQEVLTNITRHAAATRIDAYLHDMDGVLELSVRDNGKGIEPKMINNPKSLGLIGMRERCHHLGGTIDIRGKRGKGTTVIVKLPAREKRA